MTLDPLTVGQMKRSPEEFMMVDQYQHIGSVSFLKLSFSTFDPS